ncbi:hypothetical protein Pint_12078 [Pistacia integerrima]|uniref:Uncharacterized protein n=1 Tax=Pistacia integerrima TaxID=434235 RepID=A0ACC0XI81_9ROSI|nr:hypothetical protein Pint_12078 [Pistacia integerrima]
MLETISLFLDVYGKTQLSIRIIAFLLSAVGFGMTLFTCVSERNGMETRGQAEKQLGKVELGFSVVQLIATLLVVLGIKVIKNVTTSILLVLFAAIAVIYAFKKDAEGSATLQLENNSSSSIEHLQITSDEIGELLHDAISTPNQIDEHVNRGSTSNEFDDMRILQTFLMRVMNIGILRGVLMRLMNSLFLQVHLIRLMTSCLMQLFLKGLMKILFLPVVIIRMMNICSLQVLLTRLINIHLHTALSALDEIDEHLDTTNNPHEIRPITGSNTVDDHVNSVSLASQMTSSNGQLNGRQFSQVYMNVNICISFACLILVMIQIFLF